MDLFYPWTGTVSSKEGFFQQPRDVSPIGGHILRSFLPYGGFNRLMVRAPRGLAAWILSLCAINLVFDCSLATTSQSLIANQYVRVSKVAIPSHGSLPLPENGHFRILISEQAEAVSVRRSDNNQPLAPAENLWTLDGGRSYQIFDRIEAPVSLLSLETDTNPGRVFCAGGNACPWSIRGGDPVPIFLSEHLTVFRIPLPWSPEAHSIIVPNVEISMAGTDGRAWDAVWMETGVEVKAAHQPERGRLAGFGLGSAEPMPYLLEITFYEHPFCFCKRVRRGN